jgi:hypothetical protein
VLGGKAGNTNLIVFGLIEPRGIIPYFFLFCRKMTKIIPSNISLLESVSNCCLTSSEHFFFIAISCQEQAIY